MSQYTSAAPTTLESEPAGWAALLELGVQRRGPRTALVHRKQRGPLAVQRPFYPEAEVCHLYLLHPPGGVVGGDRLRVTVQVQRDAAVVVTTPGATKFFRSGGAEASQRQHLSIDAGGSLEWFPQENIFFPGARADLDTRVYLESGARFMGWEIHCLGRPAIEERFHRGGLSLQMRIFRDGVPLLLERLPVNEREGLSGAASLRGFPVAASFLAAGVTGELRQAVRNLLAERHRALAGATLLDDLLVVRYLGASTEAARGLFVGIWTLLRPALTGRAACPPRIWST